MFNTSMLRALRQKNLPTEITTEVVEGVLIEKSVLYNRELKQEVVISEKKTVIADEIAKLDTQIKELQTKKTELTNLK